MPLHFTGTVEQRLARLEEYGRRCDAARRRCVQTAVYRFTVRRADGKFNPLPDAQEETKLACSKHWRVFADSGVWKVDHAEDLPVRNSGHYRPPPQRTSD